MSIIERIEICQRWTFSISDRCFSSWNVKNNFDWWETHGFT